MSPIRAATVQFNHRPGDKQYNLEVVRGFVSRAEKEGVELLVFPEMCLTGYWHVRNLSKVEIEQLAEPIPNGEMTQALLSMATASGISIGAGLIEKGEDGNLYNSYVVAMPDGRSVSHRKIHTFISEHMASGSEYTVFDLPQGDRAGILICYDNNLIENARATALLGAEILIAPHQTGGTRSSSPHGMKRIEPELWLNRNKDPDAIREACQGDNGRGWLMRWLPSRAHDNGMFLLFSNGVGVDDNEVRTGNAMILDPYGRILAETDSVEDAMVVADLDPALLHNSSGGRWIQARRPELYDVLTESTGKEKPIRDVRFSDPEGES